MKYPFVFIITFLLLPTLVLVMLMSVALTELEVLLDRKKESEC